MDAPVIYSANDSIVFEEGGYAHLYGDGKVNYQSIELGAQIITMNMDSSTVFARGVTDSLGVETGKPVLKTVILLMIPKRSGIISKVRKGISIM